MRIKDLLFQSGKILHIHCQTTGVDPYMFIICVKYSKSAFHLIAYIKSLEDSKYESLLKEVEEQVDKKMSVNKDGLLFGTKAMASQIM
jgi:hypothetical protein